MRWVQLQEFPKYHASDLGDIKNKHGRLVRPYETMSGHLAVGLFKNDQQLKRGLAKLICESFVERPSLHFNTPIYLDGDLKNCSANNLRWRPKWFSIKFDSQFYRAQSVGGSVRNKKTGEIIHDIWELVHRDGILYTDVILSIYNQTYVFPTFDRFEWVEQK